MKGTEKQIKYATDLLTETENYFLKGAKNYSSADKYLCKIEELKEGEAGRVIDLLKGKKASEKEMELGDVGLFDHIEYAIYDLIEKEGVDETKVSVKHAYKKLERAGWDIRKKDIRNQAYYEKIISGDYKVIEDVIVVELEVGTFFYAPQQFELKNNTFNLEGKETFVGKIPTEKECVHIRIEEENSLTPYYYKGFYGFLIETQVEVVETQVEVVEVVETQVEVVEVVEVVETQVEVEQVVEVETLTFPTIQSFLENAHSIEECENGSLVVRPQGRVFLTADKEFCSKYLASKMFGEESKAVAKKLVKINIADKSYDFVELEKEEQ